MFITGNWHNCYVARDAVTTTNIMYF